MKILEKVYINYTVKGNYEYATACSSVRTSRTTAKGQQIYLGRVIDKERGIYKSKKHGMFTFNLSACEIKPAPEDAAVKAGKIPDNRRREILILDFGNSFFDRFISEKRYDAVLDGLRWTAIRKQGYTVCNGSVLRL